MLNYGTNLPTLMHLAKPIGKINTVSQFSAMGQSEVARTHDYC